MKSKRVKEILPTIVESYELAGKGLGEAVAETLIVYVEFAEQEAEEQAVRVFEQALQKLSESPKLTLQDMQQWVKDFRKLIGGQNDE